MIFINLKLVNNIYDGRKTVIGNISSAASDEIAIIATPLKGWGNQYSNLILDFTEYIKV